MKYAGTFAEGIIANDAGKYTRKVMTLNSRNANIDAMAIGDRARAEGRRQIGAQITGQGSDGFTPMEGSGLDALRESAVNIELDVLTARRKGQLEAAGFKSQGDMAAVAGKAAMSGAIMAGVTQMAEDAAKAGGGGG